MFTWTLGLQAKHLRKEVENNVNQTYLGFDQKKKSSTVKDAWQRKIERKMWFCSFLSVRLRLFFFKKKKLHEHARQRWFYSTIWNFVSYPVYYVPLLSVFFLQVSCSIAFVCKQWCNKRMTPKKVTWWSACTMIYVCMLFDTEYLSCAVFVGYTCFFFYFKNISKKIEVFLFILN